MTISGCILCKDVAVLVIVQNNTVAVLLQLISANWFPGHPKGEPMAGTRCQLLNGVHQHVRTAFMCASSDSNCDTWASNACASALCFTDLGPQRPTCALTLLRGSMMMHAPTASLSARRAVSRPLPALHACHLRRVKRSMLTHLVKRLAALTLPFSLFNLGVASGPMLSLREPTAKPLRAVVVVLAMGEAGYRALSGWSCAHCVYFHAGRTRLRYPPLARFGDQMVENAGNSG